MWQQKCEHVANKNRYVVQQYHECVATTILYYLPCDNAGRMTVDQRFFLHHRLVTMTPVI